MIYNNLTEIMSMHNRIIVEKKNNSTKHLCCRLKKTVFW